MFFTRHHETLNKHAGRLLQPTEALLSACDDADVFPNSSIPPLKTGVVFALERLKRALSSEDSEEIGAAIASLDDATNALAVALRETLESLLPKPGPSS